MQPTTPSQITPKLRELASTLKAMDPVYVEVRPEIWANKGNCFKNSERYCAENEGAARVFGFVLRSNGVWAEAEYHALVRLPNNELIDPTQEGTDRLLFAEINGERSQATGVHAIALKEYASVKYLVAIQNQAYKAQEDDTIFDSTGARMHVMSPDRERLLREHDVAYKEVLKAFRKKWPAF